jgi:hypothetical protein
MVAAIAFVGVGTDKDSHAVSEYTIIAILALALTFKSPQVSHGILIVYN